MSTTSGPAHRSVSNIRPSPSPNPAISDSPHTPPPRAVSGNYGSPSALRAEEETIVIEIGARNLRVGPAGDAAPQAIISYGPEEQRRAGDYRQWDNGYHKDWRKRQVGSTEWGEKHELWKLDLRELDLALVGDKIARAIREAYIKFLLLDSRPRRMVLVLPSLLPLPLLSTVLDTLFENFQPPTISLLSSPVLTTFAAGLRSALVVDIGWAETVVTGIYEYREIQSYRSIRASKWLGQEMLKTLAIAMQEASAEQAETEQEEYTRYRDVVSFEECEEVVYRMAWCKPSSDAQDTLDTTVSIPLRSTLPPRTLELPFSSLSQPCETTFFAPNIPPSQSDDHDLPIPTLLYTTLLRLPLDVRSLCMSRIIFTGSASTIPGLKPRILSELQKTINERGWDAVRGRAVDILKAKAKEKSLSLLQRRGSRQANDGPSEVTPASPQNPETPLKPPPILSGEEEYPPFPSPSSPPSHLPAHLIPQLPDPLHHARSNTPPPLHGQLRSIESLGPWTGASLLTTLKIPPVSIIERETWMSQGLGGAKRVGDMDFTGVAVGKRQSMGPTAGGMGRGVAGDRSSWTLGGFA